LMAIRGNGRESESSEGRAWALGTPAQEFLGIFERFAAPSIL
jgi:hypothetical protein